MSVGKDELFDRAARIILTSGEDGTASPAPSPSLF